MAYFGAEVIVTLNLPANYANFRQFQDFKFEFFKLDKFVEHDGLGGEHGVNVEAFHELSPGIRPFSKKAPILEITLFLDFA